MLIGIETTKHHYKVSAYAEDILISLTIPRDFYPKSHKLVGHIIGPLQLQNECLKIWVDLEQDTGFKSLLTLP